MKRKYLISAATLSIIIAVMFLATKVFTEDFSSHKIKVGFIYIGDAGTAYTNNFYRAQTEAEEVFDERIKTIAKFNIPDTGDSCEIALRELIKEGCSLIFTTSYGYGEVTKRIAKEFPDIQFCQATADNANKEPIIKNYHNFMGRIYEGRYVSGIVAGMKLLDLIKEGRIKEKDAIVGYVGAYPYAEVISGYTAFFLGVRSIVPNATMKVGYANTWSNYIAEKQIALNLIDKGCVIISQHSDTIGPATACEEATVTKNKTVFHVGYNQSMTDVAPTTSLVSSRINWEPYIIGATEAVLKGKDIEDIVKTPLKGNDCAAGFDKNWVELIGINHLIVSKDIEIEIEKAIKQFKNGSLTVFKGKYEGVNVFDESDKWNLEVPYMENEKTSAPSFCYILNDVIEILPDLDS